MLSIGMFLGALSLVALSLESFGVTAACFVIAATLIMFA
jgi:hypothetical protein